MLIAQNTGFYNRKSKTDIGEYVEATRMQHNDDAGNYILVEDKRYEIGEGERDISDRLNNKTHLLCTLYDILKYSKSGDKVNLITLLPCGHYLNRQYRDQYRKLFLMPTLRGVIDGVEKEVHINDVQVYMEGAAAYLNNKYILKDKDVGIVDIGGNTVCAMIFSHGKLIKDTISMFDLGTIKLEMDLIEKLNTQNPSWNVQEYELRGILNDSAMTYNVSTLLEKYSAQIRKKLLERKWNIAKLDLFFTGGGALMLEDGLRDTFKNVRMSETALMDNVRGAYAAGKVIYSGKNN